jgi:tetratricopeptide (TPR) repeat protein
VQRRWDLGKYYNLNLYSVILSLCGYSAGYVGDFDEGQALCERASRFAEEIGNAHSLATVEMQYAILFLAKGNGKGALEHIDKCVRYTEQGEMVILLWVAPTLLGHAYYLLGDLDNARKHFEERLEIYRSTEYPMMMAMNYHGLGMVYLDSGDHESARGHTEESLKFAEKHGDKMQKGRSMVAMGRVIGKAGPVQSTRAEEYIVQGIKILEELKLKPFQAEGHLYLGELYADCGRMEEAVTSLKKAQSMFREMGMDYWLRRTQEIMSRLDSYQS